MAQRDLHRPLLARAVTEARPREGDMDFASEWESGTVPEAHAAWERLL